VGKFSHFLAFSLNISKTVADRLKLQLMTNRKSHLGFPLTLRSMTLDDLELLYGQIILEFRDISCVSEAITSKRMKIDLYCQRWNCSPCTFLRCRAYRLRWYRTLFTRYGASNKCGVGKMCQYHSPDGATAGAFYDSI